jgi:peptide/nickel transport system substrate-binding protein
LLALTVVAAGCAPGAQTSRQQQDGGGVTSAPKTLNIGINSDAEPSEGGIAYGGGGAGGSESMFLLHAALTVYDEQGIVQPRLAARVPTIENGDWIVSPDGTMQVTWKLRPGVTWHDGTPLHAEDLVLGYRVGIDPTLFQRGTAVLRHISEVSAPDAETFVVRWKNAYIFANDMGLYSIVPLARHKFAALYDSGDKQAIYNTSNWSEDWVGLGPFKMRQWERGSHILGDAYDQYFLGRPKIDRIAIRFFGDVNTLIATIMAGDIELGTVGSFKEEEGYVLKSQWADAGRGTLTISANKLRFGAWQFRDGSAWWATDPRTRLAMLNLVDRQVMLESIMNNMSAVDDFLLPRTDGAYRLAQQSSLPKLGFDESQAHRLLAEAGFVRGPSGYRTASGQALGLELTTTDEIETNVKQLLMISDAWKRAGIEPTNVFIPGTANDKEIRAKVKGISFTSGNLNYATIEGFSTQATDTEANRYRGGNIGGYSNPTFDELLPRLVGNLKSAERDPIAAQMMKILLDQQAYLPLVYSSDFMAMAKGLTGVTGVTPAQRVTSWNAHVWEKA